MVPSQYQSTVNGMRHLLQNQPPSSDFMYKYIIIHFFSSLVWSMITLLVNDILVMVVFEELTVICH